MTESQHYIIADHHVELVFVPSKHNGLQLVGSLQPFRTTQAAEQLPAPLFSLTVDDSLKPIPRERRHRIRTFDTGNGDTIVDRTTDDGTYQFIIKDLEGHDCCLLIADQQFKHCQCALNGNFPMRHFGLNNALMLCYAFAGARHHTILIHASLVRKDGYGYAFTAKSGTGKSTQVSMWLRHIPGCDLMNDDNPIIRIINDEPFIYGSPWSGKTPCYRNIRAYLGAITRIDRDERNFVVPLQPIEAFATVLSGCSTMKWDEEIHSACCDTVQKLVEISHIYSLHCLPNREAAEVCYKAIGRKPKAEGKPTGTTPQNWKQKAPRAEIQMRNDVFLPEVVNLLEQGHTVTLPLRGISMRPFLEDGRDKALLIKAQEPKVGDAVLAEISPKTFVLHRIWAIKGEAVTLLGDGNLTPEHCTLADIKGKAIAFYRKGRQQADMTDGKKWRIYSWTWTHLRLIRRYLLAIHRRVIRFFPL